MVEEAPAQEPRPDDEPPIGWVQSLLKFSGTDTDLLRECLWRLLDNAKQAATAGRRQELYVVLSAVAFELVNRRLINEISIQGAKLSALTFLRPLLPLAVAYFYLFAVIAWNRHSTYRAAFFDYTKKAFPGLEDSGMDELLMPGDIPFVEEIPERFLPKSVNRLYRPLNIGLVVMYAFAPILFEVYAFIQLYRYGGNNPIPLSGLAALTAVLLAIGLILIFRSPEIEDFTQAPSYSKKS